MVKCSVALSSEVDRFYQANLVQNVLVRQGQKSIYPAKGMQNPRAPMGELLYRYENEMKDRGMRHSERG